MNVDIGLYPALFIPAEADDVIVPTIRNADGGQMDPPDNPDIRRTGIADNPTQYQYWMETPEVHRTLILGTVNIPPFNSQVVTDPRAAIIARCYATARLELADLANDNDIMALSCAELIAPYIPTYMLANQATARRILVETVLGAIRSNTYPVFSASSAADYAQAYALPREGQDGAPPFPGGAMRINHANLSVGMPEQFNQILNLQPPLTPAQAMGLLIFWAERPQMNHVGLSMLTTTYVAVAKRGNITAASVRKIVNGVRDDLQSVVSLSAGAVRLLFNRFLLLINANNIEGVLRRWERMLPLEALRLRLTIQQTQWAGLTVLHVIIEALASFTDFRWDQIWNLFPAEAEIVTRSIPAVMRNPYLGFNRELGELKSTNYKFIGWTCKELLVEGLGRVTLNNYGGWPAGVPFELDIRTMIVNYLRTKGPRGTITPAIRELAATAVVAGVGANARERQEYENVWIAQADAAAQAAANALAAQGQQ